MILDKPYFMTDERWYKFDLERKQWVLTEYAPKSAVKSYNEYIQEINRQYGRKNNR